jgi:hypothetical protein
MALNRSRSLCLPLTRSTNSAVIVQRLTLALEARDHLSGVHPRLDDFQRQLAADALRLLGAVDDPHAALAELAD